jgi:hypothetical protein
MILFMRRSGLEGEDPYVGLKMLLFAVGAVMALGGMLLAWTWLVAVAMVVLVVAFAVRFMPARAAKDNAAPPD